MAKPAKTTVCLWYNGDAEDAARFYAQTFPDSSVDAVHRAHGRLSVGERGDVFPSSYVMAFRASGSTGDLSSSTTKAFSFQSQPLTKSKRIAIGTRLSATGGQRGVRLVQDTWDCPGRSPPIVLTKAITDPIALPPSARSMR